MMRVLTVRQPYAWAIIHGGKDVENRPRNVAGDYRGPVAIHAGRAPFDDEATGQKEPLYRALMRGALRYRDGALEDLRTFGAIIGVVDLVDVHVARAAASGRLVDWAEHTKPEELCSPWAEWDRWHLELANPRPLTAPIPFKGALGLRTLPGEVEAEILQRLEAA
jgi:hypothetical protein